jgi:hypothetical protein
LKYFFYPLEKIETKRMNETIIIVRMSSVTMSHAFTAAATIIAKDAVEDTIAKLSAKYGFDASEAREFLLSGGIEVKKQLIPKEQMPWCGKIDPECCKAISLNNNNFTQCGRMLSEGSDYCKPCSKQVAKDGTPKWGDVHARNEGDPMEYRVGNRKVAPFSIYMKKRGIERKDVEEAAAAYEITIDPRHFEEKRRGRPTAGRAMSAPVIDVPETEPVEDVIPGQEPEVAEVAEDSGPESEDEEDTEMTYQKVMAMSASEIRALADSHGIETKEDGKFIKVSELRKRVLAALELS